jgi:hypothetical protein
MDFLIEAKIDNPLPPIVPPEPFKHSEEILAKLVLLKNLVKEDITNDFYYLQYLSTILDYLEEHNKGFLTETGCKILDFKIGEIYERFIDTTDKEKLSQKDLTRFCLYFMVGYASVIIFKGMVCVSKEEPKFLELLPPFVDAEELRLLDERAELLSPQFKKVLDIYTSILHPKYKKVFETERRSAFVKALFNPIGKINKQEIPTDMSKAKCTNPIEEDEPTD